MTKLGAIAHKDNSPPNPFAAPVAYAAGLDHGGTVAFLRDYYRRDDWKAIEQRLGAKRSGIRERLAATASKPALIASNGPMVAWAKDIPAQQAEFLWTPYIPKGMLTLITGQEKAGKTHVCCALASALSKGEPLPGMGKQEPKTVMLLSVEDHSAIVLRPKLEKMGADLSRIILPTEEFKLTLDEHGEVVLNKLVAEHKPEVVIIDPIVSFTASNLDMNRQNQVRSMLDILKRLAQRHGASVIFTRHTNKAGGSARQAGMGSVDYRAAARSELQVWIREEGGRALAHSAFNLGKTGPTQSFEIVEGRVEWRGEIKDTADQLAHGSTEKPDAAGAFDVAKAFIRAILKDGPVASNDVVARAKDEGIKERTLNRAKRGLAVVSLQQSGSWKWALPAGSDCQQAQ